MRDGLEKPKLTCRGVPLQQTHPSDTTKPGYSSVKKVKVLVQQLSRKLYIANEKNAVLSNLKGKVPQDFPFCLLAFGHMELGLLKMGSTASLSLASSMICLPNIFRPQYQSPSPRPSSLTPHI